MELERHDYLLMLIENIELDSVTNFLDYPTRRDLWKRIATLLSSGQDELQIFDLTNKAARLRQGTHSVEVFYEKIMTIWKELDRQMPNPMKYPEDITIFNSHIQRQRLYQFLAGLID